MTKKQNIAKLEKEYQKAKKVIAKYEQDIAKNKHARFNAIENVDKYLFGLREQGYITKSGHIRKNLSKAKIENLNTYFARTLRDKKSEFNQVNTTKKRTRTQPHIVENLSKRWNMSKEEVARYVKNITTLQNEQLLARLGLESDDVRELTETFQEIDFRTLQKVGEYLLKDKEQATPTIMQNYVGEDDFYNAIYDMFYKFDNLDDKLKSMTIEEIIEDELKKTNSNQLKLD